MQAVARAGIEKAKLPGAAFGLAGVAVSAGCILASACLFASTAAFGLCTHWVSHLGSVAGWPGLLFRIGLVGGGLLLGPFVVDLTSFLWRHDEWSKPQHQRATKIATIVGGAASAVSIVGAILAGIFDMLSASVVHVVSANLFFIGATVFILAYARACIARHVMPAFLKVSTAVVGGLFAVFYPVLFASAFTYFPDVAVLTMADWVTFMTATGPELALVRFFEWLTLYAVFGWIVSASVLLMRRKRAGTGPET